MAAHDIYIYECYRRYLTMTGNKNKPAIQRITYVAYNEDKLQIYLHKV
jgi:hypothetical protein